MPEILTKYPDLAIMEIKSAGGKCGENLKKQILTSCPTDRFCVLPKGEICVYGIKEITQMTQFNATDLNPYLCKDPGIYSDTNTILLVISCLFGLFFGLMLNRKKKN